jgi:hypothetical protein
MYCTDVATHCDCGEPLKTSSSGSSNRIRTKKYLTAYTVANVIKCIGVLIGVGAAIVLVYGFLNDFPWIFNLSSIGGIWIGLVTIAGAQVMEAILDIGNNTAR